jgi:quinol monooxygenase YgiN
MYGLIGKITAVSEQRDALIAILLEGINDMPGCLSYVVARDPREASAIWITEVWDSKESHAASLSLPAVRQATHRRVWGQRDDGAGRWTRIADVWTLASSDSTQRPQRQV